jgi:hypothetical protein
VCVCVIQSEREAGGRGRREGGAGQTNRHRGRFIVHLTKVTAVTTATHNRQPCLWLNYGPAHAQALASSRGL